MRSDDKPAAKVIAADELKLENELRLKVKQSLADGRKSIPAAVVFKRLRERLAGGVSRYSSR
jgi:hypothetical protein